MDARRAADDALAFEKGGMAAWAQLCSESLLLSPGAAAKADVCRACKRRRGAKPLEAALHRGRGGALFLCALPHGGMRAADAAGKSDPHAGAMLLAGTACRAKTGAIKAAKKARLLKQLSSLAFSRQISGWLNSIDTFLS